MKDMKVPTASTTTRPIGSVVQTVSQ